MATWNNSVPSKWWAMTGVGLEVLMFTLDASLVNLALPILVQVFLIAGMLIALSLGMTEIQRLGTQHPLTGSLLLVDVSITQQ